MSPTTAVTRLAPDDVCAHLRLLVPRAVMPAFDQALLKTELWLSELSAAQARKGEADAHARDSHALQMASAGARQRCREELLRAIDAALTSRPAAATAELSLIDDEQMEMQLAGEYLIEKLGHFHKVGLAALDQRLAHVFRRDVFGPKMPLSPQVLADAARLGVNALGLSEKFRVLAFRHFEALVDPVLADLLKDINSWLASGGILPQLVVQDAEERRRRESLKVSRSAAPPVDAPTPAPGAREAPLVPDVGSLDYALFTDLIDLMRTAQAVRSADRQARGGLPERAMARRETLSVLDMVQHAGSSANLLSAIATPGASIAESLKREMFANARKLGLDSDTEAAALDPQDETAVDIASNLFEVMLKDRPHAEVVAPMLARMFMPFVKAAVLDSQLFLQPQHPARQLLNTVSEACEDNAGESPQDRELLGHVDQAVQRLAEEFDGDADTFGQVEQQLSEQMGKHRKRAELAERRAGETQRGQERLELARREAEQVVEQLACEREMPAALADFLRSPFKHHLAIVALRQGADSDVSSVASKVGKPWLDLLDLASLGEPLPAERLASLRELTYAVLASSGIEGEAAANLFDNLVTALRIWSQEDAGGVAAATQSLRENLPGASASAVATFGAGPIPTDAARTAPAIIDSGPPPSEAELEEVRSLAIGTWLQISRPAEGVQQLKVSWISGVSGLMMLVNRRGARIMAVTPPELVRLKRAGACSVFKRAAPVDQAMEQLLERLRREHRPAPAPVRQQAA